MILSKQQQIEVLEKALNMYEQNTQIEWLGSPYRPSNWSMGMCHILSTVLCEYTNANNCIPEDIREIFCFSYQFMGEIDEFIPDFKRPENVEEDSSGYWFPKGDVDSRMEYLENLIQSLKS